MSSGSCFVAKFEDMSLPSGPAVVSMFTHQNAQELAEQAVSSRPPAPLHLSMHTAKQTLQLRIDAAAEIEGPGA
eukprot:5438192-Pleurochrysis_carterae.AAC.1